VTCGNYENKLLVVLLKFIRKPILQNHNIGTRTLSLILLFLKNMIIETDQNII